LSEDEEALLKQVATGLGISHKTNGNWQPFKPQSLEFISRLVSILI
jgi:hypothetical protein